MIYVEVDAALHTCISVIDERKLETKIEKKESHCARLSSNVDPTLTLT